MLVYLSVIGDVYITIQWALGCCRFGFKIILSQGTRYFPPSSICSWDGLGFCYKKLLTIMPPIAVFYLIAGGLSFTLGQYYMQSKNGFSVRVWFSRIFHLSVLLDGYSITVSLYCSVMMHGCLPMTYISSYAEMFPEKNSMVWNIVGILNKYNSWKKQIVNLCKYTRLQSAINTIHVRKSSEWAPPLLAMIIIDRQERISYAAVMFRIKFKGK